MKKNTNKNENQFLKFYLKITIIIGILGIIYPFRTSLVFLRESILYYVLGIFVVLITLLLWGYTLLSIYALIRFVKSKSDKLFMIIPIVEIISSIMGIILAISSGIFLKDAGASFRTFTFLFDVLIGIFFIAFASYLLIKKSKK